MKEGAKERMEGGAKEMKEEVKEEISKLRKEVEELKDIIKRTLSTRISTGSTGNEGVQTNRQQTDMQQLSVLIESMKEDLKQRFKKLSKQEFFIFSTIFSLEEQEKKAITYGEIAKAAKLSQGAVRDYVMRLFSKGIPLLKEKFNNKIVLLRVDPELKRIATLESLVKIASKNI